MGKLLEELKRRKVFKVAAVYAVVAWVLIQVTDVVLPTFDAPEWVNQTIIFLFILGFPITLIMAWAYEITPAGVRADTGVSLPQATTQSTDRKLIYAIFALVLLVVGFQVSESFFQSDQQSRVLSGSQTSELVPTVIRASINLDQTMVRAPILGSRTQIGVTSNGSHLVYTRIRSDVQGPVGEVLIKNLSTQQTRLLFESTQLFNVPMISPDGQRVLLSNIADLEIIPLGEGLSQTVSVDRFPSAPAEWLSDEEILYTAQDFTIHRRSLLTGEDISLTQIDGSLAHVTPHTLPGGEAFLYATFVAGDTGNESEIRVYDLRDNSTKTLINGGYMPQYAPSGHILFLRNGDLLAAPFDLEAMEINGTIVRVIEGIDSQPASVIASYGFSDAGRLIYLPGREYFPAERKLTWVDRQGETEEIELPPGNYTDPALSPDGQSLALTSTQPDGKSDIWVYDLLRGTFGRRTFAENARNSLWTPDGSQLVYQLSLQYGKGELWQSNADGTGQAEQILATPATADSFSTVDGKLLYLEGSLTINNMHSLSFRDGTWIPASLVESEFNTWGGAISPDGRWIALVSNESDRPEVYVRPYPDIENGKWQISTRGGREPEWGSEGDELFFLQEDGALMSVSIEADNNFSSGIPQQLLSGFDIDLFDGTNYAVSNDGQRFIQFQGNAEQINTVSDTGPATLTVIENWFAELNQLAPPDPQ